MRRDRLVKLLSTNEAVVRFEKKDGGRRTMRCTLNRSLVPKAERRKLDRLPTTPGLLTVFDTEKSDWRSFYLNNITSVEKIAV